MKILLISPRGIYFSNNTKLQILVHQSTNLINWKKIFSGLSPGLLVLAALTPSNYEIKFIDENYDQIDFSEPCDAVAISAMTQQAIRAYQIADNFKIRGIKVIIGGIHASVLPIEAKQHADSIVIGEAEYIWPQLLDDLKIGKLQPYYKLNKQVNLKDSPIPRYDLLNSENYHTFWVQTTRGCPHDCEFCAATNIFGSKYRFKSISQVINEIQFIINRFGKMHFAFSDDNLFVNNKYSKELLEAIIPLKIRYHAQSDISIAEKDELLDLLTKSGCTFLLIGLESASADSLKGLDKHNWKYRQFEKYTKNIAKIQSRGIGVQGALMIGHDLDDTSIFQKTIDFIISNKLYESQITISTPLPGTRLRAKLIKENRLLQTPWENYTFVDVNFIPKNMTKEQLENGLINIYATIDKEWGYLNKMEYFKEIHKNLLKKEI
jgi:radical SAM superfamily enzyme YgiQ (UPF0313 family)